ncbi:hypothetical protein AZE42_08621 [Rhizopogon vesiculosus]|nr:hypothetical protein AZE42_08621 [Rhizopogon vesiculosus]
MAQFAL